MEFLNVWALCVKTTLGFFWKAGWAFVLGYSVSAMIQAFVPKARLTKYMGNPNLRSISIATVFGAASSSCSFAALAAARALVLKGAHFVAAVAFMFASTNLVIELGVLILIFLGWQFMAAEIIGGLFLIAISSILIRITYPKQWLDNARKKVEHDSPKEDEDFDWKKRIKSREGWYLVGHRFVMDWKMVWEEILIGFTVAGFVAVLIPSSFWEKIFLLDIGLQLPSWLIVVENAMIAPFVAAATFIGSMGNIPLATVLNANGVLFAGIMGFIYSDLMVPPLVAINAKYYGRRVAFYIAGIMWVSIVLTAIILHGIFSLFEIIPQSHRVVEDVTRFALDYTFWLNLFMVGIAGYMTFLHRQHTKIKTNRKHAHEGSRLSLKKIVLILMMTILTGGSVVWLISAFIDAQ